MKPVVHFVFRNTQKMNAILIAIMIARFKHIVKSLNTVKMSSVILIHVTMSLIEPNRAILFYPARIIPILKNKMCLRFDDICERYNIFILKHNTQVLI